MSLARLAALILLSGLLSGCVAISATEHAAAACEGERMVETRLYLGLASPNGPVREEAFRAFVDAEVTPRWKDGYTILAADGAWLSEARHVTESEPTRILVRLNDGSPKARADAEAIRAAYVRQFSQESVLRTDAPACASF